MPTSFADLSHHQASVDLAAYARAGHDRVFLKATESTDYVDPTFAARWRQAAAAGLARGAYHFARAANDGAAECEHFLAAVRAAGGYGPRDVLVLDAEDTRTPARAAANAREFTARAVLRGVGAGLVYTGRWYADPNGLTAAVVAPGWRRLWLSDYTPGQPDGQVEVPAGWTRGQVAARQWTDRAAVAGVGGPCDYNRVLADWLTPPPAPTPEPEPEEDPDMLILQRTDGLAYLIAPGYRAGISGDVMATLRAAGVPVRTGVPGEDIAAVAAAVGAQALGDTVLTAVQQLQQTLAGVGRQVGALSDDEAKTLTALGGAEQRILTAVQQVIVDPQVDNDDPAAVVAALRDALARGTAEPA